MEIFKHKKDHSRFMYMHPIILMIMFDAQNWAIEQGLPYIVTSTVSTIAEDEALSRTSASHRDGRSFDLSIRGWDLIDQIRVISYINTRYKKYHYLSLAGVSRIAYLHDNSNGEHIHFAIHSKFAKEIHLADN